MVTLSDPARHERLLDAAWLGDRWGITWSISCASCTVKPANEVSTWTADGVRIGRVEITPSGAPAIAAAGDRFAVVWTEATGSSTQIRFKALTSELDEAAPEAMVAPGELHTPAVAWNGNRFGISERHVANNGCRVAEVLFLDCVGSVIERSIVRPCAAFSAPQGRALTGVRDGFALAEWRSIDVVGNVWVTVLEPGIGTLALHFGPGAPSQPTLAVGARPGSRDIFAASTWPYGNLALFDSISPRLIEASVPPDTSLDLAVLDDAGRSVPVVAWGASGDPAVHVAIGAATFRLDGFTTGPKWIRLGVTADSIGVFVDDGIAKYVRVQCR